MENSKKILITGAAGFIGFHLAARLLQKEYSIIGFDNLNDYYDVRLKKDRLDLLKKHSSFRFIKGDLVDSTLIQKIFTNEKPDIVINLAAQAGVRYSIDHPQAYIDSNVIGFFHILEACRHHPVRHLIFASSSSVYGSRDIVPFRTTDMVDNPISLYAATKKTNELMAYTYSHLYKIPSTGLRFFTVYGPWGRPDMACFKFADLIMKDQPIQVYNHGDMLRDFTYIDDIVSGIEKMVEHPPIENPQGDRYKIYNIGNNHPEKLMDFIDILGHELGRGVKKEFLPMQAGDVYQTYADISDLVEDFGFSPKTSIEEGLKRFVAWYKEYKRIT